MNFRTKSIYAICIMLLSTPFMFGGQQDSCADLWNCESNEYNAAMSAYSKAYNAWVVACKKQQQEEKGDYWKGQIPPCSGAPVEPSFSTYITSCSKNWSCTPSSYTLDYELVDLMYSPPGKASTVTYTTSSGSGSTWGLSTTQGNSSNIKISVGASGNFFGGGGFSFDESLGQGSSTTNSTQFQIASTLATSEGLASPSTDTVDHSQDVFYLWINPVFTVVPGTTPGYTIQSSPAPPSNIVEFHVGELTGAETVPSYKTQLLAALSPQDKQSILQTDPFSSGGSIPTGARYIRLPCPSSGAPCPSPQQLDGPDNAGDTRPTAGVTLTYSSSQSNNTTNTQTSSAEVGFTVTESGGFGDFFKVSSSQGLSNTMTWSQSSSSGSSTTNSYTASAVFSTTTVGFHDLIDVYFDTLYNTFAFASETNGQGIPPNERPSISGVVTRNGVPLVNSPVLVKLANGTTRQVFTNAQGIYRIYRAPAGAASIETIGQTQSLTVDPTKPVLFDIKR